MHTHCQHFRNPTCADVVWNWTTVHDRAFKTVQKLVTEAPERELMIQCDASQKRLGAVLMQDGQPIVYASRAMTDSEIGYALIEKEMLAIGL